MLEDTPVVAQIFKETMNSPFMNTNEGSKEDALKLLSTVMAIVVNEVDKNDGKNRDRGRLINNRDQLMNKGGQGNGNRDHQGKYENGNDFIF